MTIEIDRPRDEAEALAFMRIACESLVVPLTVAPSWLEREGIDNVRVARVDGQLAGGLSVQAVGQWFGGRRVPCGIVRTVAVSAEHRGSRVADAFLRASLVEQRAAGLPISMLFPATQVIYRRIGFEQAGAWVDWTVPLSELPTKDRELPVTRVDVGDPAIPPLYQAFAKSTAGMLDRSPWLWRRTIDPPIPVELSAFLLGPVGAPEGYVIVHTEKDPNGKYAALRVRDRAFTTPRAIRRARSFFAEHRSMFDSVRLCSGLVEPLFVGLPNQLQRAMRREDWMLRVLDVPAALTARGYAPTARGEAHLRVLDDVLSPHEQRIVLRVSDGVATVEPGGDGAITIDVRGLASMYTGHLASAEVAALGLVEGDARVLDGLFAGPSPWVNEIV
jgi:predicted acetyltransferase